MEDLNETNAEALAEEKRESRHYGHGKFHQVRPGLPPGTPIVDPEAPPPKMYAICYGPDTVFEVDIKSPEQIRELVGKYPVVWLNVDGLGSTATISALGAIFGLHRLAIEDIIHVHQRPKVEEYKEDLFVVTRLVTISEFLETEQISFFLGAGYLLSFQEDVGDCFDPVRDRIRQARGRIRQGGADYLLYCLLDSIVDAGFPILEQYGDRLEEIEDEILEQPRAATLARAHQIKRDLIELRRIIWPFREAVNFLMRDSSSRITAETRLYLRDCYDHAIRVMDLVESYRELCADLSDLYLSSNANRLNEVMSLLTAVASIFIPLTFIVGVYGMNFDPDSSPWNMPELRWYWGYPICILLMVTVAVGMAIFFRKRGWFVVPSRAASMQSSRKRKQKVKS